MIDVLHIIAQATQAATQAVASTAPVSDWHSALVVAYGKLQLALAAGSIAIFGLTFTAVSTLTRIKDKLYDDKMYQDLVKRQRAIDPTLKEYRPYEQLTRVFQTARWFALGNVALHILLAFVIRWQLALVAFAAFTILLLLVAWFAYLFHVNWAAITELDQRRLDEAREKERREREQNPKPYVRLNGV